MQRFNMTLSGVAALLLACTGLAASSHAFAIENGPAPTFSSVQADGPFSVAVVK